MILEAVRERGSAALSEDLRKVVSVVEKEGGCLFLAEDEPALLRFLGQHLEHSESIFPISRGSWRQEVESLMSLLQGQRESKNKLSLVIVGSSGGESAKSFGSGAARGFAKWVDGAHHCQLQLEESKGRFARMVRELLGWNGEAAAQPDGVQLQTLFFHAAVGVFLVYDWEQNAFSPLQAG